MDNQKLMLSTPPYKIGEVRIFRCHYTQTWQWYYRKKNVDNDTIFFLECEVNMTP